MIKNDENDSQAPSAMSFGAKMNMAKIRANNNIKVIWRLRHDQQIPFVFQGPLMSSARIHAESSGSSGPSTMLVPVRPCAVLAGSISLKAGNVLKLL